MCLCLLYIYIHTYIHTFHTCFVVKQMICSSSVCIFHLVLCFVLCSHCIVCEAKSTHPRRVFRTPSCHCLMHASCFLHCRTRSQQWQRRKNELWANLCAARRWKALMRFRKMNTFPGCLSPNTKTVTFMKIVCEWMKERGWTLFSTSWRYKTISSTYSTYVIFWHLLPGRKYQSYLFLLRIVCDLGATKPIQGSNGYRFFKAR